MQKIYVICEGKTEVNFVKQVLCSYIRNALLIPITLPTGFQGGNIKKGGGGSYRQWIEHIRDVMLGDNDCYYTTMFDLYKMPSDLPCSLANLNPLQKAKLCEEQFLQDLGSPNNFIPYVQLHEFEALLFVSPDDTAKFLSAIANTQENLKQKIAEISIHFDSPEDINDGEATAPSKRLIALNPRYAGMKTRAWEAISNTEDIRNKCAHFDSWLRKLEDIR